MKYDHPPDVKPPVVESAEKREILERIRRFADQGRDDTMPPPRLTKEDYETAIADVPPKDRPLFDEL